MKATRRTFFLALFIALVLFLSLVYFGSGGQTGNQTNVDPSLQTSTELVSTLVNIPSNAISLSPISMIVYFQVVANSAPESSFEYPIVVTCYPGNLIILILIVVLTIWFSKSRFENVEQEFTSVPTILAEKLIEYFDMGELKRLCFELSIDYEDIDGETKTLIVLELIGYCKRRGRLQELIERARRHRPHVSWP